MFMRDNVIKKGLALVVIITMFTTISVSAYSLTDWNLYLKTTSFAWGDRLQTSGSVIRDAWEDAIDDWDNACSAYFYYASGSRSVLNSGYEDSDELFGWVDVVHNNGSVSHFFA